MKTTTKEKIISAIVLGLFFITVWFMLNMVLLTFILTFIFYFLLRLVKKLLGYTPLKRTPDSVILIFVYLLGVAFVTLCSVAFVPILVHQVTDIAKAFIRFDFNTIRDSLDPRIADLVWNMDINSYISEAGRLILQQLMNVGKVGVNVILAIALSFILLLEKGHIRKFGEVMNKSKISFIYQYFTNFGGNFCRTFAKVMKVQVTIAFVNSVISIIFLAILGFPNIWGLGVMIFLLGLIPVAGVVISLVPLTIIAFNVGGVVKIVQVLIMVAVIHAIEAYILNPKLMADRVRLPVSFVFIILLVSERYLGVWGLLIGVPIFVYMMAAFEIDYSEEYNKGKHRWFRRFKSSKSAAKENEASVEPVDAAEPPDRQ